MSTQQSRSVPPLPAGVRVDRSGGLRARVSDHAVRRYAERVLAIVVPEGLSDPDAVDWLDDRGVDVRRIRERLAYAGGMAIRYGARTILPGGQRVIVSGSTVVTVNPRLGK